MRYDSPRFWKTITGETSNVTITYQTDTTGINWAALHDAIRDDDFHNGRSADQYRRSFESSYAVAIARDGDAVVGTARMLSDKVSNAYIADVWTQIAYRRRGIARQMIELLEARAQGQQISLWTDSAHGFYERLGYTRTGNTHYEKVIGHWLASA